VRLAGEVPDPARMPTGCPFHPRCAHATAVCANERPALRTVDGRDVACHHADRLDLTAQAA
jgi:peptide/nickel transport system ATP-binding protein